MTPDEILADAKDEAEAMGTGVAFQLRRRMERAADAEAEARDKVKAAFRKALENGAGEEAEAIFKEGPEAEAWDSARDHHTAAKLALENYARDQAHDAERYRKLRRELAEAYYGSTPTWNVDELVEAWGIREEYAE